MVAKEGDFAYYRIFGLLILTFILSVLAVSAQVTIDTPAATASYVSSASNVVVGVTFSNANALWATGFVSTDSGTTWTEIFNESNGSVNDLFFNVTVLSTNFTTDSNYTLNVSVTMNNDSSEGLATTSVANIVNLDTTNPVANIQFTKKDLTNLTSTLKADYGSEIRVNCTPTDSTSNVDIIQNYIAIKYPGLGSYTENLTLTKNTTSQLTATISESQSNSLGEFSVKCFVQDNAGNTLETILNFTTQSAVVGGSSPFIDPDFVAPIAKKVIGKGTMEDYAGKYGPLPEQGEARLIKKLGGIRMLLAEEEHEVKVEDIGDDSVTLLISSEPFTVTINVNETKEVDVNADGINDLEIYLHKIHQKAADLVFKEISSPAPVVEEVMETPVEEVTDVVETPEEKGNFGWLWTLLILVIVIIVLMIIVHKISGRGGQGEGKAPIKFTPRDLGSGNDASSWGRKSDNSAKPFY